MIDHELRGHLVEMLEACRERGMQPPFVVCAASRNGSVLCIRCSDGAEPDVLAEHFEPAGFTLPITCMVLDQAGGAVHITMEAERMVFHSYEIEANR
jgi:hypothetical protein